MNYYLKVLKNYFNFDDRASRSEYWYFILFSIIFSVLAAVIDSLFGLTLSPGLPYGPVYLVYGLAVMIPGIAVAIRRLHDIGKSGWYFLVIFIPIAGAIWLIVLLVTEGNHGENEYGTDPQEEMTE